MNYHYVFNRTRYGRNFTITVSSHRESGISFSRGGKMVNYIPVVTIESGICPFWSYSASGLNSDGEPIWNYGHSRSQGICDPISKRDALRLAAKLWNN